MRTFVRALVATSALFFLVLVPSAGASTIAAGDYVNFVDRNGSPGGEFGLKVYDTPGGPLIDSFITFCLQKTEYMNFTSTFIVGSITDHTLTDPTTRGGNALGEDPISNQTAWLYNQFLDGGLGALGYNGSATSANALQNAFWYFEDELTSSEKLAQAGNPYIAAANAAVSGGFRNNGSVRVLNLYNYDPTKAGGIGLEAQDQLVRVPEPATLWLLGSGIAALGLRRRLVFLQ